MSWGCKQKPNGCGWASWEQYEGSGQRDWWCDLCERSGTLMVRIEGDRTWWCGEPARPVVDLSLQPCPTPQNHPDSTLRRVPAGRDNP